MEKHFMQKVVTITSIALGAVFIFLGLQAAFHLLLLIFAAILVATYFRSVSELITRRTKINQWISLTSVVVGTLAIIGGFARGLGAQITQQTKDLQGQIPSLTQSVSDKLSQHSAGRWILKQTERFQSEGGEGGQQSLSTIASFFSSTFGVLGDLYIILIVSIYFTATPLMYKKMVLKMVPETKRDRWSKLLTESYETLGKWITGQMAAMLIVFVATGVGLGIMGVPYALVFALLAGLLNFIPNFGPLIAMIPAALVALTVSPELALGVVILYVVIQNIEGEFITPLIQQRMVKLAPAAIITFQVFMGIIAGGLGVVMATPLLAVLTVWIHKLYIKSIADKS